MKKKSNSFFFIFPSKIRDGKHYCQFLNTGSIIYCIPVGKSNKILSVFFFLFPFFFLSFLTIIFQSSYTYTEDIEWKEFEFHDHEIDIIKVDSEEGIGTVALITGKTVDDTTLISVDLHSLVVRDCLFFIFYFLFILFFSLPFFKKKNNSKILKVNKKIMLIGLHLMEEKENHVCWGRKSNFNELR